MDSSTALGFAAFTLLPRIGGLWKIAARKGKITVIAQIAIVALFYASKNYGKKDDVLNRLYGRLCNLPLWLVPSCTLGALGFDAVVQGSKLSKRLLWAAMGFGMIPTLLETFEDGLDSITNGEADVPALTAMILGLCLRQVRAVAVILFMLTGGEAFEEYALNRAGKSLHRLLEENQSFAHVQLPSGVIQDTPVHEVKEGDVVLVKSGQEVPVDGNVVDPSNRKPSYVSTACVDESLLTGEGVPVTKCVDEQVFGGSRNKGEAFWIKASVPYRSSIVALMRAKLKEALESKASIELKSKEFVSTFTPLTFATAGVACLVSSLRKQSSREQWESALAVFMSATPCPAGIGVPIAMLSGMSVASRYFGGTIKSGTALEALAAVDAVVLDKTGTLTEGRPVVKSMEISRNAGDMKGPEVLKLLASVEQLSSHPLARAVIDHYAFQVKARSVQLCLVKDFHGDTNNRGVSGYVEDYTVKIGAKEFCFDEFSKDENGPTTDDLEAFFSIEKGTISVVRGRFIFYDKLRPSAVTLVQRLKALSIDIHVLSGDRSGHLEKACSQLGVKNFKSCWPHEKAVYIESLRSQGKTVLMVGDGANDSAALACANVGMSIGASNLASDSASVVLMNEDLVNIEHLISMSRRVVQIAKNTVGYGMSCSFIQMFVAALGMCSPFQSAISQEFIDLGAVLYSLTALKMENNVGE